VKTEMTGAEANEKVNTCLSREDRWANHRRAKGKGGINKSEFLAHKKKKRNEI